MNKHTTLKDNETTQELPSGSSFVQEQENREPSGKELIQREPIDGTPFHIVDLGQGWFIALGRYRLTEVGDKEELIQKVKDKDWNIILDTIAILTMKGE